MQVCISLQIDNHASTPPLSFLQAGCPSCRPTNSDVKYENLACGMRDLLGILLKWQTTSKCLWVAAAGRNTVDELDAGWLCGAVHSSSAVAPRPLQPA